MRDVIGAWGIENGEPGIVGFEMVARDELRMPGAIPVVP